MAHGVATAAAASGSGLKVVLEPIPGLTSAGVLGINGLFLQTPPMDSFDREYAYNHADYQTARAGQFSMGSGRNLRTTSFDTLVLDYAAWAFYNDVPIGDITQMLVDICERGEPVLLTAAHDVPGSGYGNWPLSLAGPEVQWPATLRTLRVSEKAGEPDARYMNLSFTEYRDPTTGGRGQQRDTIKLPTWVKMYADGHATDATGRRIGSPPAHPVTLALLAHIFYRDPSQWRAIARANGIKKAGPNDSLFLAVVPSKERNLAKPNKVVRKFLIPKITSETRAHHDPNRPNVAVGTGSIPV